MKDIFEKIVVFFSNLDNEERSMLFGSVGILFISFLIISIWKIGLPAEEAPTPPEEEVIEEIIEEPEVEEVTEFNMPRTDYKIIGFEDIETVHASFIFGQEDRALSTVKIGDIRHSVFENEDDLPLEDWIKEKLLKHSEENNPDDARYDLQIIFDRKRETEKGEATELIRMNDFKTLEILLPLEGNVLSFYYKTERDATNNIEKAREDILKIIEAIK